MTPDIHSPERNVCSQKTHGKLTTVKDGPTLESNAFQAAESIGHGNAERDFALTLSFRDPSVDQRTSGVGATWFFKLELEACKRLAADKSKGQCQFIEIEIARLDYLGN